MDANGEDRVRVQVCLVPGCIPAYFVRVWKQKYKYNKYVGS